MTSKTIPKVGKLYARSQNIKNGQGSLVAVEFLDKLIRGFAKNSANYINTAHEAPFVYRERQLASTLAPALAKITHSFLVELPVTREKISVKKKAKSDYKYLGWADYWVNYKGYDYYLELKHDFVSVISKKVTQSSLGKWKYMNETQLPDLEREAKYLSGETKGIFTIALEVITIFNFRDKNYHSSELHDSEKLLSIQKRYFEEFKDCNWSGLWVLRNNLVENCYYEDEKHKETYPAVLFLSKIKKIQ